ncbi:MAG: glycosyltransferase, partial [Fervidobacterium sp.]
GSGGSGLGARAFSVLRDFARQYDVIEYVMFHPPVPHSKVPEFIAMSDICIVPLPDLPQWRNQCPLKLLEYLAMNKPIIATDIPANRNVLGANKCVIYVRTANPNEIAKAIAYAYENRKMLKEWASCGRAIVEEKYSWTKVAGNLEAYLYSLWS